MEKTVESAEKNLDVLFFIPCFFYFCKKQATFLKFVRNIYNLKFCYRGESADLGVCSRKDSLSYVLALSQTSHGFYVSSIQDFLKTMWEKEKLLVTSNFSFSRSVFIFNLSSLKFKDHVQWDISTV